MTSQESNRLYAEMCRIRRFEDEVLRQRGLGKVHGPIHLYRGQEAVAVGVCANLRKDDYLVGNHRSHGHCIAKGASLKRLMAELFAKSTGVCGGKGGSMHLADMANGILGANGIVAGGIGIASGAALSSKMRGESRVSACFFGDGAVSRGPFHEVLAIASLWKLPVVFVCENNHYQQWMPTRAAAVKERLSDLAASYAMPGVSVDGQSVSAVKRVSAEAVSRARDGHGPTLIEALTYRFDGHSANDEETYRTTEEVEYWKANRDPLKLFRQELLEAGSITGEIEKEILNSIEDELQKAVKFASESPDPMPAAAVLDVLAADWIFRP